MIRTFTQHDLIRFLYRETTAEESRDIERMIHVDPSLQRELKLLAETISALDDALLSPSFIHSAENETGRIEA